MTKIDDRDKEWFGEQITEINSSLTLRDLPENEKQIWRDVSEYYVFGDGSIPVAPVPHEIRGILAPFDEEMARRARSYLVSRFSR